MIRSFEQAFEELSSVVERLQQGDLPLEETITLFERGMKLSFECEKFLDAAGRRVEVLVQREDGGVGTEEFDEGDE